MLKDTSHQTLANLKKAFGGEAEANHKYLAFAATADKEGYPQAAKLFRAAASAEAVHALAHLRALGGVKSTRENLQEAIRGETYEFTSMYPEMIEAAVAEGEAEAQASFARANAVEQVHAQLYQKCLEELENPAAVEIFVCQVCGNTAENQAPEICSVCRAPQSRFSRVS